MKTTPIRQRKPSEEGYMLVVVIFLLAVLMISLTVAAPVIKKEIQRDREVEMMHRGKQYARAVKLYYKKFGAYPPNVDALVKSSEVRFLRKKYVDLITGQEEWKIVRVGQQKTPPMGFFGQPLGAAGATGTGGVTGATPFGSSSIGGAGTSSSGNSLFGSSNSGPGTAASPSTASGSFTDPNSGTGSASATSGSAAATADTGLSGQSFGGVPIIGFSPNSSKQSILVYRTKDHYNEWEFLYYPIEDQMTQGGGNLGAIGQPISGSTTPVGGFSITPPSATPSPTPSPSP
jgi:type II secretory pathway pseudopilin PulG